MSRGEQILGINWRVGGLSTGGDNTCLTLVREADSQVHVLTACSCVSLFIVHWTR